MLLGQLKQHPDTRHLPVVVAGPTGGRLAALRAGAAGYLEGVNGTRALDHAADALEQFNARTVRRLALIQDGAELDPATMTLLGAGDDVDVVEVPSAEAIDRLGAEGADCAVLPVAEHGEGALRAARAGRRDERVCASCR